MYVIDLHWLEKTYSNLSIDDLCGGLHDLVEGNEHAEAYCALAYWCAAHVRGGYDGRHGDVYKAFAYVIGGCDTLNQALVYNRFSGRDYVSLSCDFRCDLLHMMVKADFPENVYNRICEAM